MTVKNYVLDINKTSLQHPSIVLRQDDYNIYTINVSVTDNGTPVDLGSYTLNFLGITPSGAKIIDSKNFITTPADLAVGKFSYRFPKEAAGSKGVYDIAYFRLKTTSGATSTIDLNLRVLGGIDLTADEVKDYITVDDTLQNTLVAEVFKKVDAKVDEHLATVKKGDKGDTGPAGKDGYMPVIGGRNYILNSSGMNASSSNRPVILGGTGDSHANIDLQADRIVMTNNQGSKEFFYGLANSYTDITKTPLIAGNTYTVSVKARGTSPQIALRIGFQNMSPAAAIGFTELDNTKWTKATFTFTIPVGTPAIYMRLNGAINNNIFAFSGNETIEFKEVMLEQSNVASDWTPAPEDVDSAIAKAPKLNGNNMYVGNNTYMGTNTFMDGVSLNGKNVVNNIKDTDWLDIPLAAGRTGTAKYKVSLGKVFVHIDGVKGVTAGGNNAQGQLCTLPVNPYPFYTRYMVPVDNTSRVLTLTPNGVLYLLSSMGNTLKETDSYNVDFTVV